MKIRQSILTLIGTCCLLNIAYAENVSVSTESNPCNVLSSTHGNKFQTTDKQLDALLYYKKNNGPGVSGGFGAVVSGTHYDAEITASCVKGLLTIEWNSTDFKGKVVGHLSKMPSKGIYALHGNINGQKVFYTDMPFIGYK